MADLDAAEPAARDRDGPVVGHEVRDAHEFGERIESVDHVPDVRNVHDGPEFQVRPVGIDVDVRRFFRILAPYRQLELRRIREIQRVFVLSDDSRSADRDRAKHLACGADDGEEGVLEARDPGGELVHAKVLRGGDRDDELRRRAGEGNKRIIIRPEERVLADGRTGNIEIPGAVDHEFRYLFEFQGTCERGAAPDRDRAEEFCVAVRAPDDRPFISREILHLRIAVEHEVPGHGDVLRLGGIVHDEPAGYGQVRSFREGIHEQRAVHRQVRGADRIV